MRYPILALTTAITAAGAASLLPVVVGAARTAATFIRALGELSTWAV